MSARIGTKLSASTDIAADATGVAPTVGEKIALLVAERASLQARADGEARVSLLPAFRGFVGGRRLQLAGAGSVVTTGTATGMSALSAIVVLVGVLIMRYIVIFSAQT